jgi:beta-galactosidase
MKDEFNALHVQRQPGPLAPALGARVEQFYALEADVPLSGTWGEGKATIWAEQLRVSAGDAETLLTYGPGNGWLDGQPAAVTRRLGRGRITYVGAWLDEALMRAAVQWMLRTSGVNAAFGPVPDPVEVCLRTGAGKQVFLLINHGQQSEEVPLPGTFRRVLEGRQAAGKLVLRPREVELLVTGAGTGR